MPPSPSGHPAHNTAGKPQKRLLKSGVLQVHCEYDANNKLIRKTETSPKGTTTWDYSFDEDGRLLTAERNGVREELYVYNEAGQRVAVERRNPLKDEAHRLTLLKYDLQGRLFSVSGRRFIWAKDGSLREIIGDTDSARYFYSAGTRLDRFETPDGENIEYRYDKNGLMPVALLLDGRPVARYQWKNGLRLERADDLTTGMSYVFRYRQGKASSAPRQYIPDQVTITGSVKEMFLAGIWLLLRFGDPKEQRAVERYLKTVVNPKTGEELRSITLDISTDQIGSIRLFSTTDGTVIGEVEYDSFGNVVSDSLAGLRFPLGFACGFIDQYSGFVRFGHRDYDPKTGRFTAKDPLGDTGGDHDLYDYCVDDPVSRTDPMGLYFIDTLDERSLPRYLAQPALQNAEQADAGDTGVGQTGVGAGTPLLPQENASPDAFAGALALPSGPPPALHPSSAPYPFSSSFPSSSSRFFRSRAPSLAPALLQSLAVKGGQDERLNQSSPFSAFAKGATRTVSSFLPASVGRVSEPWEASPPFFPYFRETPGRVFSPSPALTDGNMNGPGKSPYFPHVQNTPARAFSPSPSFSEGNLNGQGESPYFPYFQGAEQSGFGPGIAMSPQWDTRRHTLVGPPVLPSSAEAGMGLDMLASIGGRAERFISDTYGAFSQGMEQKRNQIDALLEAKHREQRGDQLDAFRENRLREAYMRNMGEVYNSYNDSGSEAAEKNSVAWNAIGESLSRQNKLGEYKQYSDESQRIAHGARRAIRKAAEEYGIPWEAIAGAIQDEVTARQDYMGWKGVYDKTQDIVLSAIPPWLIDLLAEQNCPKPLNPVLHDVGPGNVHIATAREIFDGLESGQDTSSPLAEYLKPYLTLNAARDPELTERNWKSFYNRVLATPKGNAYFAAHYMRQGQRELLPYMRNKTPQEQAAILMSWYKQGPAYLERYLAGPEAGKRPITPGEGLGIAKNWNAMKSTVLEGQKPPPEIPYWAR